MSPRGSSRLVHITDSSGRHCRLSLIAKFVHTTDSVCTTELVYTPCQLPIMAYFRLWTHTPWFIIRPQISEPREVTPSPTLVSACYRVWLVPQFAGRCPSRAERGHHKLLEGRFKPHGLEFQTDKCLSKAHLCGFSGFLEQKTKSCGLLSCSKCLFSSVSPWLSIGYCRALRPGPSSRTLRLLTQTGLGMAMLILVPAFLLLPYPGSLCAL